MDPRAYQFAQQPVPQPVPPIPPQNHNDDPDDYEPEGRRRGPWSILVAIAIIILVCAIGGAGYIGWSYWSGQNEYDELSKLVKMNEFDELTQVDDRETVTTLGSVNIDWEALRAINSDVVGWVYMPDTIINYPIVWKEGDDEYYTKHNFSQSTAGQFGAEYGCVSLSGENKPTWTDQVNYISGHHMRNGSMFALFGLFTSSKTFNEHRVVYVFTPEGNFKCTSFCTDKVWGEATDIIIPNFASQDDMWLYMKLRLKDSIVRPDPQYLQSVEELQQVFAFYTCNEPDNRYRIITYCKVDEFLPAGSNVAYGSSIVDDNIIDTVESAIGERLDD